MRNDTGTSSTQQPPQSAADLGIYTSLLESAVENKFQALLAIHKSDFEKHATDSAEHIDDKVSTLKKDVEKELTSARNNVIASIGIFAALFAFISVNINIFSRIDSVYPAIAVICSMWVCLVGLIYTMSLFMRNERQSLKWGALIVVPLVAIAIMCAGFLLESKSSPGGADKLAEIKVNLK